MLTFDLPGHGQSPGEPGAVKSYDSVLNDISLIRKWTMNRFPGLSQVLLGHSMGGNFAINYALRRREIDSVDAPLAGLVLCAPMLLPPRPLPRPIIFAAWLTGILVPSISFRGKVDPSLLTRDPVQAEAIEADPLMHATISMYLATQLVSQGRWSIDHARDIDAETLLMYGEADTMIDLDACENVVIRIGEKATRLKWPNALHDLFHDHDRDDVIKQLVAWLAALDLTTFGDDTD